MKPIRWVALLVAVGTFTGYARATAKPDFLKPGSLPARETTAHIMKRATSRGAEMSGPRRMLRVGRLGEAEHPIQAPDALDQSQTPPPSNPSYGEGASVGAQTADLGFTGATLSDTGSFPPDSMGAVGPSQLLVAVNGRLRSFDKHTGQADGVLNAGMDTFFAPVMTPQARTFTSDPRVRYDRLSGRWFLVIIDVPGGTGAGPNRVLIAVSNTGVLTSSTVWSFFYFQHDLVSPAGDTGLFADYPTLGIDANALTIGVNLFGSRTFSNTTAFVIRKSSLLGAGPMVATAFRGLIPNGNTGGPYTPQGVDNDDPNATESYLIAVNSRFYGRLVLLRISNPGGTPSISDSIGITTAATSGPITVPHLGNTGGSNGNLDGLDYRLLAAHFRNGRLWTAQNIGVDNTGSATGTKTRNAVRWYELQGIASGSTPSVAQSGTLFEPSATNTTDQRSYWMGTVMVSGQGHVVLGCSAAGTNEYINAAFAGRLATDPPGTMQAASLYTSSSTAYNPVYDTGGAAGRRWGDYSFTSLDPDDDMTMWTIQEFGNATDSYGVRVVKLMAPPPATPTSCNPATVAPGASNISVVVTGTQVNGSGFFDPGAGFPNHLSASVSGAGVTVNSVIYADPTHITLNISAASGASGGARTITVTNPDGQSVASLTGLLTVSGTVTNLPPTATVLLSPSTPRTNDLVTATATKSDPNGDPVLLTFIWKRNGTVVKTTTASSALTDMLDLSVSGNGDRGDSIAVTVTPNDGHADGSPATSSVVTVANTAPVATADEAGTAEDTLATFTLIGDDTDADGDKLTVTAASTPAHGTVTVLPNGSGIAYTPAENYNGEDAFTYTVSDGHAGTATGSVSVAVTEVNDAPTAGNDSLPAREDTPLSIPSTDLLTNDSPGPADEGAQTLTVTAGPATTAGGDVSVAADGTLTYTPPLHFAGSDSFDYTVTDNGTTNGTSDPKSATATVSVTVARVATQVAYTTQPGGAQAGAALEPQPVVTVQDAGGVTVTDHTGSVTLVLKAGTGTSGAALGGTATVALENGVATFTGLSVDIAGTGYVLVATADGLTAAESAPFDVARLPYTLLDARRALVLAAGLDAATAQDMARLGPTVDLGTAVRVAAEAVRG